MKFLWAYAALGAALLFSAASPVSAAPYGDANGDGAVTIEDVRLLARIAGGLQPADSAQRRAGDVAPLVNYDDGVFGDGKVTLDDAARVLARVQGRLPGDWPAKPSYYQLQTGNTFTVRKYNETGQPSGSPDVTGTVQASMNETVGGVTYVVRPVLGSDGSEQRIVVGKVENGQTVPFTDSLGRPALGATRFDFSGSTSSFNPPLVLMVFPAENGTTWSGTTQGVISGFNAAITYTGTVTRPDPVTVPAGTFSDALKVTLTYNGTASLATATGSEYVWFAPFLGPIQHGYTRTTSSFLGSQTKTVNPDLKLAGATVHGVAYP